MMSFNDRRLLDNIVTQIFKQKAMGRLSAQEADCLLDLKRLIEKGEAPGLFDALRQAFIRPGTCGEDGEKRELILETLRSADLRNPEDIRMVTEVVSELVELENKEV